MRSALPSPPVFMLKSGAACLCEMKQCARASHKLHVDLLVIVDYDS